MFDRFKKGYHNMNDKTRQEVTEWCKAWDNNECQRCGASFAELEKQAQIIEEATGRKRILPVFTIDHKDGDSSHNDGYIDVDESNKPIRLNDIKKASKQIWYKFGNCRRLCWACNRIAGVITRKSPSSERMTQEKQDRINHEQIFLFEIENQVNTRGHVCYRAICKAGKNVCDSSEITCNRYLDTEIRTPENPTGKFHSFAYECNGKFCNGTHVSWANIKPDVIIEEERKQLEREWEMQYDLSHWTTKRYEEHEPSTEEQAIFQWEHSQLSSGKDWISKEQYVNQRLKVNW